MNPAFEIHLGDSFEILKTFPAESFDACVTDPPYGIRFIGQAWDGEDIENEARDRATYSTDPSSRAGENGGHRSIAAEAVIEGFSFAGIEREEAYAKIARARIAEAIGPLFAAA